MTPKLFFQGRLSHRLRSLRTLLGTTADVLARRGVGRPLVPQWPASFEIGTLFYRRQFNHALSLPNITEARDYFDSLSTMAGSMPRVRRQPSAPGAPRGEWLEPADVTSLCTLLYFHGGGYAFHAHVSRHFTALLAQALGMRVFALDYRLTPEHPHPAQLEDALAAYRHLLECGTPSGRLVIGGDSAGGHLALMVLAALRQTGLPQPALALALSPWTDIGRRGASQFGNDRFDMVQGYQTLQYGAWLKGGGTWTDAELSPMG